MEDILDILFADELRNLNGFEIEGEISFPKEILAAAVSESILGNDNNDSDDEENILQPNDIQKLMKHLKVSEANVYFKGDEVCLTLNVSK